MAVPTSDRLQAEWLLLEAAAGFEAIGRAIAVAHDRWTDEGADEETLDWLAGLLDQSGWWHGRLTTQLRLPASRCQEYPDGHLR